MSKLHTGKTLAALLAAILLTGCADNSAPLTPASETASAAESVGTSPISEEQPGPDIEPSEPPVGACIESFTTDAGNGLRTFGIPTDSDYPMAAVSNGMILSTVYGDSAITAILTDLSNGESRSIDIPFGDDEVSSDYTIIVNGRPVVINMTDKTLTVYDNNMQPLNTETLGFISYSCTSIGDTIAMAETSEGNRIVFVKIADDGSISISEKSVQLAEGVVLSQILGLVREGEYLISCYDSNTYQMNHAVFRTDTGEVILLDAEDSQTVYTVGNGLAITEYSSPEVVLFDPAHPDMKKLLKAPDGTYFIPSPQESDSIYFYGTTSLQDGGCRLSLYRYDIDSCDLTASLETDIDSEYFYIEWVYEYDGYVILDAACDDATRFLCWKPETAANANGYNAISGNDYSTLNHRLAQDILDRYSIEVKYGSDGVRHFDDYAVLAESDEKLINNALNTLDSFFGKFPAGFFEELTSKTAYFDRIVIYLTGKIIPNLNDSQSISDASAFVTTENSQQIMVLDIKQTYMLDRNLAHEFMHMIENAMYDMSYDENGEWRGKENFTRWTMLNPADFSYYYSYTDEYGFTLGYDATEYNGTAYYEGSGIDINSIYFVDGYSMTFPNEDRARIFEYIATATADRLPEYFKGSAMQLKAAYLCACIRDSFDCITDDTALFWENSIDPQYTLEYFRENYDIDEYMQWNAAG